MPSVVALRRQDAITERTQQMTSTAKEFMRHYIKASKVGPTDQVRRRRTDQEHGGQADVGHVQFQIPGQCQKLLVPMSIPKGPESQRPPQPLTYMNI